MVDRSPHRWPRLAYADWSEAALTLQLWMQIVGKVRLASTPWLNHSWHVPFTVTARGLGTSPMPAGDEIVEFEFDFLHHRLVARTSAGGDLALPLEPRTVADFYAEVLRLLAGLGVDVTPSGQPSEIPDAIPFASDRVHSAYDPEAAHAFWRILISADRVLKLFRTGFVGKASPVHFFWGSFDLAVTRFSGRRAPLHPGGVPGLSDRVVREAYSHEVSSAGFWPGGPAYPHAIFYSYAYPEPPGFRSAESAHPLISKRVSANLCCPTPPFMRATIRTRWSFNFSRKPMRPPPIAAPGTGPGSIARSAFRERRARSTEPPHVWAERARRGAAFPGGVGFSPGRCRPTARVRGGKRVAQEDLQNGASAVLRPGAASLIRKNRR